MMTEGALQSDLVDASVVATMGSVIAGLLALIEARGAIVVHVTAATAGEGTTSIARGLAAAAARSEWCKTALVDATPRSAPPGTADDPIITMRTTMIDGVPVDVGQLVTGRYGAPNTAQMRLALAALRDKYVLTVLDCPPVLAAPEIAATARLSDGVLLVVGAGEVDSSKVAAAQAQLQQYDANILGVVLNRQQDYLPRVVSRRF